MLAAVIAGVSVGVGLAAVCASALMGARNYAALPDRVPLHFDGYGRPDSFGPRPAIFVMPAASLFVAGMWIAVLVTQGPGPIQNVCIGGAIFDFTLIALFFLHRGILNVALGKIERMHPFAFWKN